MTCKNCDRATLERDRALGELANERAISAALRRQVAECEAHNADLVKDAAVVNAAVEQAIAPDFASIKDALDHILRLFGKQYWALTAAQAQAKELRAELAGARTDYGQTVPVASAPDAAILAETQAQRAAESDGFSDSGDAQPAGKGG